MRFNIGDTVRIKSREDIIKTLDNNDICQIAFCRENMFVYCRKVCRITGTWNTTYIMKDDTDDYVWVDEWVEPILPVVRLPEDLFTL